MGIWEIFFPRTNAVPPQCSISIQNNPVVCITNIARRFAPLTLADIIDKFWALTSHTLFRLATDRGLPQCFKCHMTIKSNRIFWKRYQKWIWFGFRVACKH